MESQHGVKVQHSPLTHLHICLVESFLEEMQLVRTIRCSRPSSFRYLDTLLWAMGLGLQLEPDKLTEVRSWILKLMISQSNEASYVILLSQSWACQYNQVKETFTLVIKYHRHSRKISVAKFIK
mmetsp:Transcript_16573/g.18761  ORF Transcript_16573/g.18761 Transcript_16573/m.18761 type:complete len:124 (-) Transcript_16573:27-398(-)